MTIVKGDVVIRGRELVKRYIASSLDWPSVYMNGPSHANQRKADHILEMLEDFGYEFEQFEYEPNGEIKSKTGAKLI
jgi:hypothetical protein